MTALTAPIIFDALKPVAAKYGFRLDLREDRVNLLNSRDVLCARVMVAADLSLPPLGGGFPRIERMQQGQKQLCGALVRDAIVAALKAVA
jgi:hypothetical protein